MLPSPSWLFVMAQAFRFSNARGRCFSPSIRALLDWYVTILRSHLADRTRFKRWRVWWERY